MGRFWQSEEKENSRAVMGRRAVKEVMTIGREKTLYGHGRKAGEELVGC